MSDENKKSVHLISMNKAKTAAQIVIKDAEMRSSITRHVKKGAEGKWITKEGTAYKFDD